MKSHIYKNEILFFLRKNVNINFERCALVPSKTVTLFSFFFRNIKSITLASFIASFEVKTFNVPFKNDS